MSGGRTSPLSLGFERGSFARIDVRTQIMPADLGGRFQRENMLRRNHLLFVEPFPDSCLGHLQKPGSGRLAAHLLDGDFEGDGGVVNRHGC